VAWLTALPPPLSSRNASTSALFQLDMVTLCADRDRQGGQRASGGGRPTRTRAFAQVPEETARPKKTDAPSRSWIDPGAPCTGARRPGGLTCSRRRRRSGT
jgi:hypothetical protein